MADVHTPEKRSYNMSRVRSHGNKSTELKFLTILKFEGITGWRRKYKLFGKPDFTFVKYKIAVFIDGCFWHGCPRSCKPLPHKNLFWKTKIRKNRYRDQIVTRTLRKRGWSVIRIWEHDLITGAKLSIRRIQALIRNK